MAHILISNIFICVLFNFSSSFRFKNYVQPCFSSVLLRISLISLYHDAFILTLKSFHYDPQIVHLDSLHKSLFLTQSTLTAQFFSLFLSI